MEEAVRRRSARLSQSPNTQVSLSPLKRFRTPSKGSMEESMHRSEKIKKSKRKSSMSRRSLVATLECIQSNEISNTTEGLHSDANRAVGPKQGYNQKINSDISFTKSTKRDVEDTSNIVDIASIPSSTIATVSLPKEMTSNDTSLNITVTSMPSSSKADSRISRLKTEYKEWLSQRNKYKTLQCECETNLQSANFKHLTIDHSEYLYYHEQINDLEDKITSALTVVSNAMSTVERLKELHMIRLNQQCEEAFNIAFKQREGDDPRLLIETILTLHNIDVCD